LINVFFLNIILYENIKFKFMLKFYYHFNWQVGNSKHKLISFNFTLKPIISSKNSSCVFVSQSLVPIFFLSHIAPLLLQKKLRMRR
jgi:hypothetical protein